MYTQVDIGEVNMIKGQLENKLKLVNAKKEQSIAVRLAGKVKNFTGKTPAIIQAKIRENLVTIRFSWNLNETEKGISKNCNDPDLVNLLRNKSLEYIKSKLFIVVTGVLGRNIKLKEIEGDFFQEEVIVQFQLMDLAS